MDSGREQFSPSPAAAKRQMAISDTSSKHRSRLPSTILFFLLIGSLSAFFWEQRNASKVRQENESLRAITNELGRLRAENEEVTRLRAENREIERLRKDNEDLYRLRNEVGELRKQKLEWNKTRALAASQSQTTTPTTVTPTSSSATPANPPTTQTPKPWLGFYYVKIPPTPDSDGSKANEKIGTLVSLVRSNSPAEKAGLQVDDIIVKVNDQPVRKVEELDAALRILSIGQFVSLDVVRQELPIRIQMQVEDRNQNQ
jgi:hypothetical protein